MVEGKLKAILIFEILGRPPEYVKETMEKLIEQIKNIPEIKLTNMNIAEPKELETNKDFFTTFADVEIETDLMKLMQIIYNFMPSHVEIVTPEELRIRNSDMNVFFNELTSRLHRYDEVAKSLLLERQNLAEKIKNGQLKIEDVDMNAKKEKKVRKKKS